MGSSGGAPIANFYHNISGYEVSFIDASFDTDGFITAWSWNFGDGETSSEQNPVHEYAQSGTYDVMLTVYDNSGKFGAKTCEIEVGSSIPYELIAFVVIACVCGVVAFTLYRRAKHG